MRHVPAAAVTRSVRGQSFDVEWVELPGTGTVYSYTVVQHALHPDLAPVVPYVSGIVELDGTQGEGARMLVNIVDCEPGEISIGTRVRVVFEHVNDDMATPRFRPVPDDQPSDEEPDNEEKE